MDKAHAARASFRRSIVLVGIALFALPTTVFAVPPIGPDFTELGRDILQFNVPGGGGYAVADLDGDGRDDVALGALTGSRGELLVVGKAASGAIAFKQAIVTDDSTFVQVLRVSQPTGPAHILTVSDSGNAMEFAGWPLQQIHAFTIQTNALNAVVGDIDGDGANELVVRTYSLMIAYSLTSGNQLWTYNLDGAGPIALAQLDGDNALEIIVGGVTPGIIIDGATRMLDWQYPDTFGYLLATGTLPPDGVARFVGESGRITAYSGSPYSPLWDYSGDFNQMGALDIGRIGNRTMPVILFQHAYDGDVFLLDPISHNSTLFISPSFSLGFNSYSLTTVDIDGDSTREVVLGNSVNIALADGSSGILRWTATSRSGPFNIVSIADSNGAGSSKILSASDYTFNTYGYGAAGLSIRNAATGTLEWQSPVPASLDEPFAITPRRFLVAQIAGSPNPLIVIAGSADFNDGRVVVVDGVNHAVTAQFGDESGGPLLNRPVQDAAIVDMNGDGINDVLVGTAAYGSPSGVKLQAFSLSGTPIWTSVGMGNFYENLSKVLVLDPASGGGDSVVAVLDSGLRAFGRLSHLLNWSLTVTNNGAVIVPIGVSGAEIAVETDNNLAFYSVSTRSFLRQFQVADRIDSVFPLDGQLGRLLVSSGGRLRLIDGHDGLEVATSPFLGDQLAQQNQLAVETVSPGVWRIAVGSTVGLFRYRLELSDRVFSSGFEAIP